MCALVLVGDIMWHLNKIPKTLHVYWGGGKLPYLRYLTVASFMRLNPTWEVVFYVPLSPILHHSWNTPEQKHVEGYSDCLYMIKELRVTIRMINFKTLGFSNIASEVHKSDFIRWTILNKPGGLWADMDIIFIRSMDELCFNKEEFSEVNTVVCRGSYGHSIGFLMGGEGNTYFDTIYRASLKNYNKNEYQCIGSLLCNRLFPTIASTQANGTIPYNLPMDVVYPYDFNSFKELFTKTSIDRFTENTIGVHWYGGSKIAGAYLNNTNGGLNTHGNSIIDKLIRNESK